LEFPSLGFCIMRPGDTGIVGSIMADLEEGNEID
jgi:hypothetical protein